MTRWGFLLALVLAWLAASVGYVAGRELQAQEDEAEARLRNASLWLELDEVERQTSVVEKRTSALEVRAVELDDARFSAARR